MSGAKKLCSGLLAVSIGLIAIALSAALCAIAPPILQPTQAQIQNPQQQQIEKLLQQAEQQTRHGENTEAIATLQQVLTLARQLQDKKAEATALIGIAFNYRNIGQPQQALEFYNKALPILKEAGALTVLAAILNDIGSKLNNTWAIALFG